MIIEKKQPAKTVKRDYGDTVVPKTAAIILSGLTSNLVFLNDRLLAHVSNFGYIGIYAKLFGKQKKLSRYELIDVLNIRDCLFAINSAQHNTTIFKIAKNDPMSWYLMDIMPDQQTVDLFAKTIRSSMPPIPCSFESGHGGIFIRLDDSLINSNQPITKAIETITDTEVA